MLRGRALDGCKGKPRGAAVKALKNLNVLRLQTSTRDVLRSRRGRTRRSDPQHDRRGSRSFEGFFDPTPDPLRTPGRNARRLSVEGAGDVEEGSVPHDGARPSKRQRSDSELLRPGAPLKLMKTMRIQGQQRVVLSKRQYRRLLNLRAKDYREIRLLRESKRSRSGDVRRPLCERVAVAALLQADGVPANKVQHVMATVMHYAIGDVPRKFLFSASSALNYVRAAGSALKQRLAAEVGSSAPFSFFVGIDTSNRGGDLGSFVVSFVNNGAVTCQFYEFDRPLATTGVELASSLERVVAELEKAGGIFGGFSSDGAASMVGTYNGLGALMMQERRIRHDTCEHYASARLLAVLDSLWPPVMNVPSVSQFLYMTWYILNSDWNLYRGRIIQYLKKEPRSKSLRALLRRFGDENPEKALAAALAGVKKPLKPNVLRWGTVADIIKFVPLYLEAIRFAFDLERNTVGAGAEVGSIAAICAQWIKWSGSSKLLVLLDLASEFVGLIWEPANKEIDLLDSDFKLEGCFKVLSRPRRTLSLLMKVEHYLGNPSLLASFETVVSVYGQERHDEVVNMCTFMFQLSRSSILRNSGRYLSGIYLFGGFADPNFALFVFEAFSHWRDKAEKPLQRTEEGLRLEKALRESEDDVAQREWLEELLQGPSWGRICNLVSILKKSKKTFIETIQEADESDSSIFTLRTWMAALSHTRCVEKTFLDWDHQSRGEGGMKKKASVASGKAVTIQTKEARGQLRIVRIKNTGSFCNNQSPAKSGCDLKRRQMLLRQ